MVEEPKPKRLKVDRGSMHSVVPDELWLMILFHLNMVDLSMMSATSRRYNLLCKDPSLPPYFIFDYEHVKSSLTAVNAAMERKTNLEKLRFTNNNLNVIDDITVLSLVEKAKESLKVLIFNPDIILEKYLEKFECLTQLEVLTFTTNELSTIGVDAITKLKNLKELKIPRIKKGYLPDLIRLFRELKNLVVVDLTNCRMNLKNEIVKTLSKNNPNLEHLNLSSCSFVFDVGINDLTENCPKLKYLNLSCCGGLSVEDFDAISNGSNLLDLKLVGCYRLTDRCLQKIANGCNQLRHLDIRSCRLVQDGGMIAFAQNCPKLHYLDLSYCTLLTKKGLKEIANCKKLRHLSLDGCQNVKVPLELIAMACNELRYLNLGDCNFIKDSGVEAIVQNCHKLKHLNLYGCTSLSQKLIKEVKDVIAIVHTNLEPSAQCSRAVLEANRVMGQMSQAIPRHCRDKFTWIRLYKRRVRRHLEYSWRLRSHWTQADIDLLESVQINAVQKVYGLVGKTYQERLVEVGLTTLEERLLREDMIKMWKVVHKKDIAEQSQHVFSARVIDEWSELPNYIKRAETIGAFNKQYNAYCENLLFVEIDVNP